jgi:LmbE family N-acetylglucosaminyl deacetylase
MPNRLLLIAAHPDDIALSIGGVTSRLAAAEVLLITCFSQSCSSAVSDLATVSRLRAAEDDAYAADLGFQVARLDLPDTNVRTDAGRRPLRSEDEADVRAMLRKRLGAVVRNWNADAVFVPMGIGAHLDHLHCNECAVESFASETLIFYEDLPYADMEGGPSATIRLAAEKYPDRRPRLISLAAGEFDCKLRRLDHYRSQIAPQWKQAVERYAKALVASGGYHERCWIRPPLNSTITVLLDGGFV